MKIGQRVVYTTNKKLAYHQNLISRGVLSCEEVDVFSKIEWGNSDFWDRLVVLDKQIFFKGIVVDINNAHSDGLIEITVRFDNGRKLGFIKGISDKELEKKNEKFS